MAGRLGRQALAALLDDQIVATGVSSSSVNLPFSHSSYDIIHLSMYFAKQVVWAEVVRSKGSVEDGSEAKGVLELVVLFGCW
jgi:hypothetical protein